MRLNASSFKLELCILTILLSALVTHAAPSPVRQISTASISAPTATPFTTTEIRKRAGFTRTTIANGWVIHYQIFNLISPVIPAITELRRFYIQAWQEVDRVASIGEDGTAVSELSLGEFTLSFRAEAAYANTVDWEIILAFVEKMMESTVPVTFLCHVAPPDKVAGIIIQLWVGRSKRLLGSGSP